ncbi:aa3-type cytochrome c oxidase subunit IV [Sphingobium bisphenolivorans]|nr:aa3-type cytochrome c oxidase subunit IV [Sphingobium bisphenolivorans]
MASEGNMDSANQTYAGFVSLVKWGTIASVALAALVVLLIAS